MALTFQVHVLQLTLKYFPGFRECGLQPPPMQQYVARRRLAQDVPFPRDLQQLFDEIITQAGMAYPPANIADADMMYRHLRREAHLQL